MRFEEQQTDDARLETGLLDVLMATHIRSAGPGDANAHAASSPSSPPSVTTNTTSAPIVVLKARIHELEIERSSLAEHRIRSNQQIKSLRTEVGQLRRCIHELGRTQEDETLPSASVLGVDDEVITLINRCPWDKEAMQQTRVVEEAIEWESWTVFDKWSPMPAKDILTSTNRPRTSDDSDVHTSPPGGTAALHRLQVVTFPSTKKVFTNRDATGLVEPDNMSLPPVGWEWMGGWRVDTSVAHADEDGWLYAATAHELRQGQGFDSLVGPAGKRRVRRRRWIRMRVLTHIPGATECCNQFLHLRARVASLETLTEKLSQQVLTMHGVINDRDLQAARGVMLEGEMACLKLRLIDVEKQADECQCKLAVYQNEERVLRACGKLESSSSARTRWFPSPSLRTTAALSDGSESMARPPDGQMLASDGPPMAAEAQAPGTALALLGSLRPGLLLNPVRWLQGAPLMTSADGAKGASTTRTPSAAPHAE